MLNDFCTKINLNLRDLDISRIKGELRESYDDNVLNYTIKDLDYLHSQVKDQIVFGIPPDVIIYTEIGTEGTYPHYDINATALNYYIRADQAKLWWFKSASAQSTTERSSSNLSVSYRFDLDDLTPEGYVEPKDNEAWLLNTKMIHRVEKLNPHAPRYLIRWVWLNVRYDIVLRRLKINE